MDNSELRSIGVCLRNSLSESERAIKSESIVNNIVNSIAYKNSKVIMSYRAIRNEVSLDSLIYKASSDGKSLVFPVTIGNGIMTAMMPGSSNAWKRGLYGILEPDPNNSIEINPHTIDLILCPCAAFDNNGNRIGMGAGYYDRYLPKCTSSLIAAVAFECQRVTNISPSPWDYKMDMVFTEY